MRFRSSPAEKAIRKAAKEEAALHRVVRAKAGNAKETIVNMHAEHGEQDMHASYIGEAPSGVKDTEFVRIVGEKTLKLLHDTGGYGHLHFDYDYSVEASRKSQERAAQGHPTVPYGVSPQGLYAVFRSQREMEANPFPPVEQKTYGDGWLPPEPPEA